MKLSPARYRNNVGMTLLEIMVSMLLGGVVATSALHVYIGTKTTYRSQQALSRVQENGRFAMEFISKDLRMGGYQGCLSLVAETAPGSRFNYQLKNDAFFDFTLAARGYEGSGTATWTPALASQISSVLPSGNEPLDGTDLLSIYLARRSSASITSPMFSSDSNVSISAGSDLQKDDIVVIADCEATSIAQVTDDPASGTLKHDADKGKAPQNTTKSLDRSYDTDAEIFRAQVKTYYIAASSTDNTVPALWELNITPGDNTRRELLEGVEDLQVLYGVDTDNDNTANRFVPASAFSGVGALDWEDVVAVKASILVRSLDDNVTVDPQPYVFNGGTVSNPGDRRMRRVFTTTVSIRNKLP